MKNMVESYAKTSRWVFTGWFPRELALKRIAVCPKVVIRKQYTVLYHDDGSIERFKL